MQRLSRPDLRDERGVSAVIVALVLVVLVGFGALAVDLGALWSDKKQLQNGADAAALAIAQACAGGDCGDTAGDADPFAAANKFDGNATGEVVSLTSNRVVTRADTEKGAWLGRIFSIDTLSASATSAATWGSPNRATTLPLTISGCWFQYQTGGSLGSPPPTGTEFTIPFKSKTNSTPDGSLVCGTHAAHNEAAGGFGWVDPDNEAACAATIDLDDPWLANSPGNSPPCTANISLGDTVLIPLFDEWRGSGNNAEYKVYAFAAMKITGYCFKSDQDDPVDWPGCQTIPGEKEKSPNISGTFVTFVDLGEALELGGPDAGVSSVKLELP